MTAPLVSVGIPTYNRPHYLEQALHSLLKQTHRNIEVVVSDDCFPTDENFKLCEEFKSKGLNIVYHRPEANLGGPGNHERVLSLSSGKYFLWMSDDDLLDPSFIQKGVEALENDQTLDGWISSFVNTNEENSITRTYPSMKRLTSHPIRVINFLKFFFEPESLGKTTLIVSTIFKSNKLKKYSNYYFWKKYNHWTDNVFALGLILRFKLTGTDEQLLYKRIINEPAPIPGGTYHMSYKDYTGFPIKNLGSIFKEMILVTKDIPLYSVLVAITFPVRITIDIIVKIIRSFKHRIT